MPGPEAEGRPAASVQDEIVARDEELAAIDDFLSEIATGVRVVLLDGQAGIGKTTLWRAGIAKARQRGYEVLQCRPSGAEARLSYAALADLLEPVHEQTLPALPEPQRAALGVALLLSPAGDADVDQRAVASGLLTSLRHLQQQRPLLVAVDDLQWLDTPSAALLEFALRRLDSERVGILLARRADGDELLPFDLGRAFPAERVAHLHIGPLSVGALHRLVRVRTGVALPRPTLLRVHSIAAGNPFFALETVRAIQRRGEPLASAQPLPVPKSMNALVRQRFGALPPGAMRVLQAATVPSEPTTGLVDALVDGRVSVSKGLDRAVAAEFVELEGDRIRFSHPLLASAVYGQMTSDERRKLHRRLAGLVDDPEERARHLALGAKGPDSAIATALDQAARHAAGRGASSAAAELLELAVQLTPRGETAETWRRRTEEAGYLRAAADFAGVRSILRRLRTEMPPGRERAQAVLLLAQTSSDDLEAADSLCGQALSEAGGDDRLLADIHHFHGGIAVVRGDLSLGLARTRTACALAERAGDRALLVSCLASIALYETFIGRPSPGVLERAERLEATLDTEPGVSPSAVRARRLLYGDRLDAARERIAAWYRTMTARGHEYNRARALYLLALVEVRAGRYPHASELAGEGCDIQEQSGGQDRSAALYPKGLADAYLGRVDEARAAAEEGVALSHAARDAIYWIANRSVLGFLELSLGNPTAAAAQLQGLHERLAGMGYGEPNIYPLLPDAIEAMIAIGDLATARSLVDDLGERAERLDSPWALATSLRSRGLLLAAEGELTRSLAVLQRALAAHGRMQQPFERARTLLVLGQMQRRAKQRRPARESLEAAAAIFGELGAPLWLGKATAELQRISGRAPSSGELTPSEARVAALVADGRTNREVGAELYITERTVEGHLSRIYSKLGVRSRAELARRLPRLDRDGVTGALPSRKSGSGTRDP